MALEILGNYTYTLRDDLDSASLNKGNDMLFSLGVGLVLGRFRAPVPRPFPSPAGEPVQLKLGAGAGSGGNGNGYYPARKCPDCNTPVIFQEGCLMCVSCGWNKCE